MVDSNSRFMRFAVVLALCAALLALGLVFLRPATQTVPDTTFGVQGDTVYDSLLVTGDLHVKRPLAVITTSVAPGAAETNLVYANLGATGVLTVTLPGAAKGLTYCAYVAAAQVVTVDPATGDQILALTNAAGDKITNSTPGSSVCLTALDGTYWAALTPQGTWADAN